MNIAGFQKLSLIDYPGTISSVVFTQGCLFRCAYCHNPQLIPFADRGAVDEKEVYEYLSHRQNMIEGVCITGGEPTLQKGLEHFIREIKKMGYVVKLDTNGMNPHIVRQLIDARVIDFIAMDIKAPWETYQEVIRIGTHELISRCKETFHLIQSSRIDHEFRTTILPGMHTKEDFFTIASYLKEGERYAIQQTQFEVTLEKNIPRESGIDLHGLLEELKNTFPFIEFQVR